MHDWNLKLKELLFGREPGAGRRIYMDILRLLATVFVICGHTVALARDFYCPGTVTFQILEYVTWLFTLSNLLFIMISGSLLLPVRGERPQTFFRKRFTKILLPLVIYYLLYIFAKQGLTPFYPANWPALLRRILLGPPVEAPHFWLVYTIFWLYVLTPFLRYLLQNIPDPVMHGVMAVLLLLAAADTYAPLFSVSLPVSGIVDSFVIVFVFGYYLTERGGRTAECLTLIGGACSALVTGGIIFTRGGYDDYIYNNAPTAVLAAGALVVLTKRLAGAKRTESLVTRLIGKYSFSILMIHWGVLHVVVKKLLRVDVTSGGIVGGCLLMIVLTLVLSAAGAVLVDNTLVAAVRRGLSRAARAATRLFRSCGRKS